MNIIFVAVDLLDMTGNFWHFFVNENSLKIIRKLMKKKNNNNRKEVMDEFFNRHSLFINERNIPNVPKTLTIGYIYRIDRL